MRLIDFSKGMNTLLDAIDREERADYIYMYPPRQAYRFIDAVKAEELRARSISDSGNLDVYLHFPFCKQVCSFCNLFVSAGVSSDFQDRYVRSIIDEINRNQCHLSGKEINSIYIGGGTPSLLEAGKIIEVISRISSVSNYGVEDIPEVSMEVAPDTVTREKFKQLVGAGLTRVNVGAQSLSEQEVGSIGRKHDAQLIIDSIQTLIDVGIKNVSVDLIISLPGQSFSQWRSSVEGVIALRPETICLYPFTQRPMTGFARSHIDADDQRYRKWEFAKCRLEEAGFESETHVRWKRKGSDGGYVQKKNHWGLKNIFGFGVGARSYTALVDTRNGYGLRNRKRIIENYISAIESGDSPITDGFVMTLDERKRKAIVLNMISLCRSWYASLFHSDPMDDFAEELMFLNENGLVKISDSHITTTELGLKYRDLVVQIMFSDNVRALVGSHDYRELLQSL